MSINFLYIINNFGLAFISTFYVPLPSDLK